MNSWIDRAVRRALESPAAPGKQSGWYLSPPEVIDRVIDARMIYHTTTEPRADQIMAEGFRDHATRNPRITHVNLYPPGVWMSDTAVLDDELFDGVGLFNFDAERQHFIALEVPSKDLRAVRTVNDPTWPALQYWEQAAFWNRFPRRRLTLDAVIALRLNAMTASDRRPMKTWIAERRQAGYSLIFAERVARALDGTQAASASRRR
jgi:hypothetical protein